MMKYWKPYESIREKKKTRKEKVVDFA